MFNARKARIERGGTSKMIRPIRAAAVKQQKQKQEASVAAGEEEELELVSDRSNENDVDSSIETFPTLRKRSRSSSSNCSYADCYNDREHGKNRWRAWKEPTPHRGMWDRDDGDQGEEEEE